MNTTRPYRLERYENIHDYIENMLDNIDNLFQEKERLVFDKSIRESEIND